MSETFYCIYCGEPFEVDHDTENYGNITCTKCRYRMKSKNKKEKDFVNNEFQRVRIFNHNKCALCENTYNKLKLHPVALFNPHSKMHIILCDDCYQEYKILKTLKPFVDRLLYREICRFHGGKTYISETEYEEIIYGYRHE